MKFIHISRRGVNFATGWTECNPVGLTRGKHS